MEASPAAQRRGGKWGSQACVSHASSLLLVSDRQDNASPLAKRPLRVYGGASSGMVIGGKPGISMTCDPTEGGIGGPPSGGGGGAGGMPLLV